MLYKTVICVIHNYSSKYRCYFVCKHVLKSALTKALMPKNGDVLKKTKKPTQYLYPMKSQLVSCDALVNWPNLRNKVQVCTNFSYHNAMS